MTKKKPKRKKGRKPGSASSKEKKYIAVNHETRTTEEMAAELNRSEDFVRKLVAEIPIIQRTEEVGDWVARLHSSYFWTGIKKGLIGIEVSYFEKAWSAYSDQFCSSGDIVATDELMIKDLVMLDIFSARASEQKTKVDRLISKLEKDIEKEERVSEDVRNQTMLKKWRTQLLSVQSALKTVSANFLDYQGKKDKKLHDLKGSRDQRFKEREESTRNIFELIKKLETPKSRSVEGHMAAKVAIAAQVVRDNWNELTEFEDGTLDKPFLSPEGELKDARLQNEQKEANRVENA